MITIRNCREEPSPENRPVRSSNENFREKLRLVPQNLHGYLPLFSFARNEVFGIFLRSPKSNGEIGIDASGLYGPKSRH